MNDWIQPRNSRRDLKAFQDAYETRISHDHWRAEALQKDGIQNAWDARTDRKHGKGWKCDIQYLSRQDGSPDFLVITDSGTTGLIGQIPTSEKELIEILQRDDPKEKIAYFLSLDWSKKDEGGDNVGSRGRGKLMYLGSSKDDKFYFESVRSSDGKYLFSSNYITKGHEGKVSPPAIDEAGRAIRRSALGNRLPELTEPGTRIIIPSPHPEIVGAVESGEFIPQIQKTWWEIMKKFGTSVVVNGIAAPPSDWVPVESSGFKVRKDYGPIDLGEGLKIKRMSLCYTEDKFVPGDYQGVAVQRNGMTVERKPMSSLKSELPEDKVYGSVEFERDLSEAMGKLEGPEHYDFKWNKYPANQVLRQMKATLDLFAKEHNLQEDERAKSSVEQRAAEVSAQRKLNKLAKKLGLTGRGLGPHGAKEKHRRKPDEKLRLSLTEFATPDDTRRVDVGGEVTGLCAVPINQFRDALQVEVRTSLYHHIGRNVPGADIRKQLSIPDSSSPRIGIGSITVDNTYATGQYHFRARMIAMEDKILDGDRTVSKGDILDQEDRTFWVAQDPPEPGLFNIIGIPRPDRHDQYIWYGPGDRGMNLYYNLDHPGFEALLDDTEKLEEVLVREGIVFLWTMYASQAQALPNPQTDLEKEAAALEGQTFEEQLDWVLQKRSENLWEL